MKRDREKRHKTAKKRHGDEESKRKREKKENKLAIFNCLGNCP